ncbi:transcriptional repressor LexA [Aliikangiella coralliicola]|uniref:LexA repressor n=1 Tax=Aliikangiella coralliicola TaxID=2592383 RepID=A0A545U0J0_9GAMM|nr:transcriptional repressor LexA [Aliikangiella coralliicola]TQV82987.1 transcriptional repressor LexA [Aliikangiella coralliicola]
MKELTSRQSEVFEILKEYVENYGIAPTHVELAELIGVSSSKAAADHLKALEKKNVIKIYPDKPRGIKVLESNDNELPLIGSVAAGLPIEAVENVEAYITIPEVLKRKKPTFLLRVRGDSMIDEGILDGDLIAVRKSNTAEIGQIVVARIDDEVTVKRLERQGNNAVLQPANECYEPIVLPAENLAIEGQFVGLIRA